MEQTVLQGKGDGNGISKMLRNGQPVEVMELDKSGIVQRRWMHSPDGRVELILNKDSSNTYFSRSLREWKKAIFDAFLPVGFPHSVSQDYLAYQTYDSLQAFFSTIVALLANRALLESLGVGDANSSATYALILTVLKDAMSRVATILFAQRFGLRIEPDAKRYRFLADVFNDTAFFLGLFSPYFGFGGKVVALGVGEALRALCGVAAGASKAALSVHFAKHDNLAELNAKEASQETAVGLVGLLFGTFVVKLVEDHTSVVLLMSLLVLGHLWVNYLGVRSVCMTTLNRQRATILFDTFARGKGLLSPAEVAQRENILWWDPHVTSRFGGPGASIEIASDYGQAMGIDSVVKYISVDDRDFTMFIPYNLSLGAHAIRILLWKGADADPLVAIEAWLKAVLLARSIPRELAFTDELYEKSVRNVFEGEDLEKLWKDMERLGWDLGTNGFETGAPVRLQVQAMKAKDA